MWSSTDPRLDINKRAFIVILRPSLTGHGHKMAGVGQVETKNGWSIYTSFDDYKYINADAAWNPDWQWAFQPRVDQ